jgi:bifunctional non-homologous end joining protein LigD
LPGCRFGIDAACSMDLITPGKRSEPFDDNDWLFDLKLDGFRGLADTIVGRMLSKNGHRLKRFEGLLDGLPAGYIFDGEIVALDDDGLPRFNDLMFGRREPVYVPFDVLFVEGEDVRVHR